MSYKTSSRMTGTVSNAQPADDGRVAGNNTRAVDEENFNHDLADLEAAVGLHMNQSISTVTSAQVGGHTRPVGGPGLAKWQHGDTDPDNDVPRSLLIEPNTVSPSTKRAGTTGGHNVRSKNLGMFDSTALPLLWDADTSQTHDEQVSGPRLSKRPRPVLLRTNTTSAKERAMWTWVNITNLDSFIRDVYDYFEGGGMWCILSFNALRLMETLFVAVLLTFLCQCVDYGRLSRSNSLSEVVVPQCTRHMSTIWSLGIWLYSFFFIWKSVQFFFEIRRLSHLRNFFVHLLDIPDEDMQTVSWQDIVARIMALRDHNPRTAANVVPKHRQFMGHQSKERLDAHDIANRLMRKENYLIALINKDVLDLSLPIPLLRGRHLFSKTMEWYLQFGILDMAFNDLGQVHQDFLRADRRGVTSQKLKQRLYVAGILNLIFAPFVFAYVVIVYFFTYYNEYQKDPKLAAARKYTALAEWKFREFNELPHLFYERLHMSYPFATRYLDQFPKRITEEVARTVAFMSGALTAVLAVLTILDSELFLGFEITKDRTVLFYLGIFGAIWAMTRGIVSEETTVFNPEYAMRNVIDYTHYMPKHWEGRLHSFDVKQDFSELYKMKVVIFLEEILGIITTPMLLLLSLPKCSDQIVDFFREFTLHVDGLGYVCSFAVFDFQKGMDVGKQHAAKDDVREDYYSTKHGKMAASYYGFIDNYVINPKTGIPGHQPPGMRHQHFHPPPTFPALNSPTFAAELHGSQAPRLDTGRSRSRLPGSVSGPAAGAPRATRATFAAPSPMASLLLDPRHHPQNSSLGRSLHQPRGLRHGYRGESVVVEERLKETGADRTGMDSDSFGENDALGESTWETSPGHGLTRENSATNAGEPEAGVLGMIYQFRQSQRHRRGGPVV